MLAARGSVEAFHAAVSPAVTLATVVAVAVKEMATVAPLSSVRVRVKISLTSTVAGVNLSTWATAVADPLHLANAMSHVLRFKECWATRYKSHPGIGWLGLACRVKC